MVFLFIFLTAFSSDIWSRTVNCHSSINSVEDLDKCLERNNLEATKSTQEILDWKQKLRISSPLSIEVTKVQSMVAENCEGQESPKFLALKLGQEIEKILQAGSLQIKDWKVPNFPETGAKNYSMKASAGCDVKDLLKRMKSDVDQLLPDLTNVYNLGLALDTTSSQEKNMQILAASIDAIYESIPADGKISFVVTSYGDKFRSGLKFEGDKSYVIPRVKNFILSQKIHGGGHPTEFVYGGSYITSKNLARAHGLIFNWTNASGDNTKAQTRNGSIVYDLRGLKGFANKNVHIIRNVFLKCSDR
jgi:hypothetical protein